MPRGQGKTTETTIKGPRPGERAQMLKWYGGKFYLAGRIVEKLNEYPHTRYVETDGGGLAVLQAKNPEGVAEYANDINGWLQNFWATLADEDASKEFMRRVSATPFSMRTFEAAKKAHRRIQYDMTEPDVEAAVNLFVVARQCRQGGLKSYQNPTKRIRRGMNEAVSAWLTAVDQGPEVIGRMRRVELWNTDAIECYNELDSDETIFYSDPPYFPDSRSKTARDAYEFEMSREEHEERLKALADIDGAFVLSGYPTELYEDYAKRCGWNCERITIDNKASGSKKKEKKIECLWSNF